MSKREMTARQKARKVRKAGAAEQRAAVWVETHGGMVVSAKAH